MQRPAKELFFFDGILFVLKTKLKLKGRVTYANAVRDTEAHTRPFKMSPVLSRQPSLNSAFPPGLGSRHKGEHASLAWT